MNFISISFEGMPKPEPEMNKVMQKSVLLSILLA